MGFTKHSINQSNYENHMLCKFRNHFIQSKHMTIKVQDEWNEIQTWSQPQLITNQYYYEHINMVLMRYTYMSKRGGNMNILMLMVCDMGQIYNYRV